VAADGEDLMILACTVFAWSTRVTDGQTDGRTDRQQNSGFVARFLTKFSFFAERKMTFLAAKSFGAYVSVSLNDVVHRLPM